MLVALLTFVKDFLEQTGRSSFQEVLHKRKQRTLDYQGVLDSLEQSKRSKNSLQRKVRTLQAQLESRPVSGRTASATMASAIASVTASARASTRNSARRDSTKTSARVTTTPVKTAKRPANLVQHNKQVLFNFYSEAPRAVNDPVWQRNMQKSPRLQRAAKDRWKAKPVWQPSAFDWHQSSCAVTIKPSFKYCDCCSSAGAFISLRPLTRERPIN